MRTPYGRSNVTLQWQVLPLHAPFKTNPIQTYSTFCDCNLSGIFETVPLNLDTLRVWKWRIRTKYLPSQIPFQQYGPWFTISSNGLTEMDFRSTTAADPPAFVLPDEPCWLYLVEKSGTVL